MTIDELLRLLAAKTDYTPRVNGKGWIACCPAHSDHSPSLSISLGEDSRILLKCHTGCPIGSICHVLGITLADLFPDSNPNGATLTTLACKALPTAKGVDCGAVLADAVLDFTPECRRQLAEHLVLPEAALACMTIGYISAGPHRAEDGRPHGSCWCFPEYDDAGNTIGITCRYLGGSKMAYPGSKRGLAIPRGWQNSEGPILIVEGHSDVFALNAMGILAIGRPNNTGGGELLAKLLKEQTNRNLIVMAEQDCKPNGHIPGVEGAKKIAAHLAEKLGRPIAWVLPPDRGKDPREWARQKGLSADSSVGEWQDAGRHFIDSILKQLQHVEPSAAEDGSRKGSFRRRQDYKPFPVDALPSSAREFVTQTAAALGCDPAYVALPVLAVLGSAIGNSRAIWLKRSWQEFPIIWTLVIGDSGTLKSPALARAVKPLFRRQRQQLLDFKNEMRTYRAVKRKAHADEYSDLPEQPVLKRVVCSDTTIEKLAEILVDNPRGNILISRDELAGWFNSFSRYKASSDLPGWLELYNAGTLMVDRKSGEHRTLFVHRASVSVTGSIQPGILAKAMTSEFLEAGLAARLLLAMPPKRPKRWTDREIDPDTEERYESLVYRLLDFDLDTSDGEPVPFVLRLSADAKRIWIDFYNSWAEEQAAAEGELAAALSKLEGVAARLAIIHHVVQYAGLEMDDRREIGTNSIEAGIAMCRWFADEARRIYALMSESSAERDHRRLLEFIQSRGGSAYPRDVQRANSRKYPTADAAETALDALVKLNWGAWCDVPPTDRGGRPSRYFQQFDAPDTTDKTDTTDTTEQQPSTNGKYGKGP